jgi:hypothetical protein
MKPRILLSPESEGGSGEEGQVVVVGPEDSILSIAKANGFFWKTVWNHARNAALRAKRKEPEILMPGDEVFVPKAQPKEVDTATEQRHKFKLKGEQAKFTIQLKRFGKPRADEEYILILDGEMKTGKTDAEGKIECDVPNDATGGEIRLDGGKEIIPVRIGRLNPFESPSGVRQRLKNLGFTPDGDDETMPEQGLRSFQARHGLEASGQLDDRTKAKLRELHPT